MNKAFVLVVCLLIALIGEAQAQPPGEGPPAGPVGYARWAERVLDRPPGGIEFLDDLEGELAEMANRRRTGGDVSLDPLEADPDLARAARAHAIDMLRRDYVGHVGPDGRSVRDRVGLLHRRFVGSAGENLAEHTGLGATELRQQLGPLALKLIDGFMASPEHRENLLNPDYGHHAFGAAVRGERLVVVHVFGTRRALLEDELPLQVRSGDRLPLAFAASSGARPEKYGYAQPDTSVEEIVTLELSSNQVAVGPGTYRLAFFIPSGEQDGLFLVADGPVLVVE